MSIFIPNLDYTRDPTEHQVEASLRGLGYWPTANEDQASAASLTAKRAINSAITQFKQLVRWEPFVVKKISDEDSDELTVVETTRYFSVITAKGEILLGNGLLACSSLTVRGRTYTIGDDAFLGPVNAADEGKPYTKIILDTGSYGYRGRYGHSCGCAQYLGPRDIAITGPWGYAYDWPADAYEAVVTKANLAVLLGVNQDQEVSSVSEDDFSQQFDLVGPIDPKTLKDVWPSYFTEKVNYYRKPVVR